MPALRGGDGEGHRNHLADAPGVRAERAGPVLVDHQVTGLAAVDAQIPQAARQGRADYIRVAGGIAGPAAARVLAAGPVTWLARPMRTCACGQTGMIYGEHERAQVALKPGRARRGVRPASIQGGAGADGARTGRGEHVGGWAGHRAVPRWKASAWPHSAGPGRVLPERSARVQATRMTWCAARVLISPRSTARRSAAVASAGTAWQRCSSAAGMPALT